MGPSNNSETPLAIRKSWRNQNLKFTWLIFATLSIWAISMSFVLVKNDSSLRYQATPRVTCPLEVAQGIDTLVNEVRIGDQIWSTTNLEVVMFRNGDYIPRANSVKEFLDAGAAKKPAWCYYDGDSENGKKYGKLYNWFAVNDPRGLAPEGWHVASDEEWTILVDTLGGDGIAGAKLKSITGWKSASESNKAAAGTNSSGFTALPGGAIVFNGAPRKVEEYGSWWTSTEQPVHFAKYRSMNFVGGNVESLENYKRMGLSVRCVKEK